MDTALLRTRSRSLATVFAWLKLLRLPNLLTVPGDPLVGFLLAHAAGVSLAPAAFAAAAALFLYMAGLIWNDCADLREDTVTRPFRPIPSGKVSLKSAALGGSVLGVLAIALSFLAGPATGLAAIALLALVLAYDFFTKRFRFAGALNMGLCRGLSVMLGALAADSGRAGWQHALPAAAGMMLYTAAVTIVADRETRRVNLDRIRWLPLGAIVISFCGSWLLGYFTAAAGVAAVIAALWILGWTLRLHGTPEPQTVAMTAGSLVGAMLLVQAFFSALIPGPGAIVALCLIALLPVNMLLARTFQGS